MKKFLSVFAIFVLMLTCAICTRPLLTTFANDFIEINTKEEFLAIESNKNYRLCADINFSKTIYEPIENFSGTIDGNGHTISNITIIDQIDGAIFANLSNATIQNLNIKNLKATVSGSVATIANSATGCTFENLSISTTVLSGASVTVFANQTNSCIFDSVAVDNVTLQSDATIFCEDSSSTYQNCHFLNSNTVYLLNQDQTEELFTILSLPNFETYTADSLTQIKTQRQNLISYNFTSFADDLTYISLIEEFDEINSTNLNTLSLNDLENLKSRCQTLEGKVAGKDLELTQNLKASVQSKIDSLNSASNQNEQSQVQNNQEQNTNENTQTQSPSSPPNTTTPTEEDLTETEEPTSPPNTTSPTIDQTAEIENEETLSQNNQTLIDVSKANKNKTALVVTLSVVGIGIVLFGINFPQIVKKKKK